MAQECGFFNAQLVGEEYDRVYLAEQFAAYFASFVGNGVFGKSMQQLEVVAQTSPDMSVKVLSGQGWINGWWYRNTSNCNLSISVADGVLSRIDLVVLRWSNSERDMYLHVIEGTPSSNPVPPSIIRGADYYDLELAQISIPFGSVKITQANITDMRMNTAVCGFVTGIIDQVDTTDLFNQFQQYFNDFRTNSENVFNTWSAGQRQAYETFVTNEETAYQNYMNDMKALYQQFVTDSEKDYNDYVAAQQLALANYIIDVKAAYDTFVQQAESDYSTWEQGAEKKFDDWYDEHVTQWTTDFETWFDDIKGQLSGDIATSLQNQINEIKEELRGYYEQTTVFSDDGSQITQTSGVNKTVTVFLDKFHIRQDFYTNNIKTKAKLITFSEDGKVITESKEVI